MPLTSRRDFLVDASLATAAAFGLPLVGCGGARAVPPPNPSTAGSTAPKRPAGQQPVHELTTAPLTKVKVAFIGAGGRGSELLRDLLGIDFADVVAVCDLRSERAEAAADRVATARGKRPVVYGGSEDVWERLCDRDDVDVVYIATPWVWHVPMAVRAMERDKHAFVEVPAARSVADAWRLVDTSERKRRHCVMLENCCYGENELFVLNMVRAGVFGELKHAECAYIHDLREVLFDLDGEGSWRRRYHTLFDGNLYPTHGLGPVAQYMGIGRGDQFKLLVSMSSPEMSLSAYRTERRPNGGEHDGERYRLGDMNTSLVKTERGRTIVIQHDVVSPRPYSRINALYGTRATFLDYPPRLSLNEPAAYGLGAKGSHEWLDEADARKMRERFTHPLWKRLRERASNAGHGGMDFVMSFRHLDCLRRGATPDSVVYDAAAWSCLVELSQRSVANGSTPVAVPDFTRGLWREMQPLGIAT